MEEDKKMYRVYDTVICEYVGLPFVANNRAHAKRMISDALEKSEYAKHASDYLLREFEMVIPFEDVCRLDSLFPADSER